MRTFPFNSADYITWLRSGGRPAVNTSGDMSFSFWLRLNGHGLTQQTIMSRYNGVGNLIRTSDSSPGHISFFWIDTSLSGHDAIGGTLLNVGELYHVLCTYNDAGGAFGVPHVGRIYLNGVLDGTATSVISPIGTGGSLTWTFGEREGGGFPGDFDLGEIAFFEAELGADHAVALAGGASPSMIAHDLFEHRSLQDANDNLFFWHDKDVDLTAWTVHGTLGSADPPPIMRQWGLAA